MADRLTIKETAERYKTGYWGDLNKTEEIYIKLSELENIMEKCSIESVAELETKLQSTNADIEKAKQSLAEIYLKDRDAWKKACELAVEDRKSVV